MSDEGDRLDGHLMAADETEGLERYLRVIYDCRLGCGGRGFVLVPDERGAHMEDCECRKRAVLLYRLDQANVGERFIDFDAAKLDPAFVALNHVEINAIWDFIHRLPNRIEAGHGLYLSGPNGVAKTALTALIVRQACMLGLPAYQATLSNLVKLRLDGMRDQAAREKSEWISSAAVKVLAIEEVDKLEILSATAGGSLRHDAISEIMNDVYYRKRTLVVTANVPLLGPGGLEDRSRFPDFPTHIIDRMKSLSPLSLNGESFRIRERWVPGTP